MTYSIDHNASIFDAEKAIENLGDKDLFLSLVGMFVETLTKNLDEIKIAVDRIDNADIRMKVHILKGTASYIQAERVRRAAEILQLCIDKGDPNAIFDYYPLLIKESIKLRKSIRKYLCINNSNTVSNKIDEQFVEDEKDFNVPISEYFQLKKTNAETFDVVLTKKPSHLTVQSTSDKEKEERAHEVKVSFKSKASAGRKLSQIQPEEMMDEGKESKRYRKKEDKNETVEKCSCPLL